MRMLLNEHCITSENNAKCIKIPALNNRYICDMNIVHNSLFTRETISSSEVKFFQYTFQWHKLGGANVAWVLQVYIFKKI